MMELIPNIIIIAGSILLFGYWFRYTCRLILTAKTTRDYTAEVAIVNGLSFPEVQSRLRVESSAQLDRLRDALDRDYAMLSFLLKQTSNRSKGTAGLERVMLGVNYRVVRACYAVSRRLSVDAARRALEEMSLVVAHFANAMGEQAACA